MTTAKKTTTDAEKFAADAQETVTAQFDKVTRSLEDAASFGQENFDAMVKSSTVAAKHAEELNAEVASFSKKTMEESVAAAKELAASKTVTEFVEKQVGFAKTAMDGYLRQATKMNEMFVAAAKDSYAPLNDRVTAASETLKSYRA